MDREQAYFIHHTPFHLYCRVENAPGLLLQELRQSVADHLARGFLSKKSFQALPEEEQQGILGGLIRLLVSHACLLLSDLNWYFWLKRKGLFEHDHKFLCSLVWDMKDRLSIPKENGIRGCD